MDRGFGIEEMLMTIGCTMRMPPRARGVNAFEPSELESAKKISNQRILIEQVIGRCRFFNLINSTLPWQYCENIDYIMRAICIFTNILPPAQKRN